MAIADRENYPVFAEIVVPVKEKSRTKKVFHRVHSFEATTFVMDPDNKEEKLGSITTSVDGSILINVKDRSFFIEGKDLWNALLKVIASNTVNFERKLND